MLAFSVLLAVAASALSLSSAPTPGAGPCTGPAPSPGAVLRGPVLHVLDGVTLCVALGAMPDTWVPLELAAPRAGSATRGSAARGALMAVAFGQDVTCNVLGASGGRSIADCRVEDRLISEQIHEPEAIRAGLSWR